MVFGTALVNSLSTLDMLQKENYEQQMKCIAMINVLLLCRVYGSKVNSNEEKKSLKASHF